MYGYLLVVAIAAVHAYFNAGYLPSVLLAVAPSVGSGLVYIHGFDEYVVVGPLLVFDAVLPEGPLVATVGFALGLVLRRATGAPRAAETADRGSVDA